MLSCCNSQVIFFHMYQDYIWSVVLGLIIESQNGLAWKGLPRLIPSITQSHPLLPWSETPPTRPAFWLLTESEGSVKTLFWTDTWFSFSACINHINTWQKKKPQRNMNVVKVFFLFCAFMVPSIFIWIQILPSLPNQNRAHPSVCDHYSFPVTFIN